MLNYNPKLNRKARNLRNKSTLSEVLLWRHLKNKQRRGYKFLRQKPIDNYIVDFYCYELKLIIEIDGGSHYENQEYDLERENNLKRIGFKILRITDKRVKKDIQGVIYEIEDWIDSHVL